MKSMRCGTWETNSSSTHAICIKRHEWDEEWEKPKVRKIHFGFGEFGWEWETYTTIQDKANYLWTAICFLSDYYYIRTDIPTWKKFITQTLAQWDIHAEFEEPNMEDFYEQGYIDHASELFEWLMNMHFEPTFLAYLFDDKSKIVTGNDNETNDDFLEEIETIEKNKTYEFYYKGN